MKPGDIRFDEEGNNKVREDDDVTKYWLKHYAGGGCMLCNNTAIIELKNGARYFCICPNGQAYRWHVQELPLPKGGLAPEDEEPKGIKFFVEMALLVFCGLLSALLENLLGIIFVIFFFAMLFSPFWAPYVIKGYS